MKVNTNLKNRPCIYRITNTINGKIYVGKAKCLVNRSYNYNSSFKQDRHDHINDYLFNAMTKYGYENFIIEPLAFYEIHELAEKELTWINVLKSNNRGIGYNLRLDSSTGMITAPETSAKISENLTEQWETGIRSNHSDVMKKNWAVDLERRKSMSDYFTKLLTKYLYVVTDKEGSSNIYTYKQLQELKLDRVLVKLWKWKVSEIQFKGFVVKRINANEV